jgi:hypothetical protein
LIRDPPEQVDGLGDVPRDRLAREDAFELTLERGGGLLDVLAGERIENIQVRRVGAHPASLRNGTS